MEGTGSGLCCPALVRRPSEAVFISGRLWPLSNSRLFRVAWYKQQPLSVITLIRLSRPRICSIRSKVIEKLSKNQYVFLIKSSIIYWKLTSWYIAWVGYEPFAKSVPHFQLILAAGWWSTARSCPDAAIWKVLIKFNRFDNAPVFVFSSSVNWFRSWFFTRLFVRLCWRFLRLRRGRSNSCTVSIFYEFYHFSESVFLCFQVQTLPKDRRNSCDFEIAGISSLCDAWLVV